MFATVVCLLFVLCLVDNIRVRMGHTFKRKLPINEIEPGLLLPEPTDERWAPYDRTWTVGRVKGVAINERVIVAFDPHNEDLYMDRWCKTRRSKRYAKAVLRAYQQRLGLEAIAGEKNLTNARNT